jgi:hypothetical protein
MRAWHLAGLLLAVFMTASEPGAAQAADCAAVRQGEVSLVQDAACAGLKLMSRKRDDPRPNVVIAATWLEFVAPGNAGEWRYNDSIRKQVARISFDRPIDIPPERRSEERFIVESFYRSERLISARYVSTVCCGMRGNPIYSSINVDSERWTLLSPDDLVHPGAAANLCWQQFGGAERRGADFAAAYPRERPWSDDDFDHSRLVPAKLDMFGPVVINTQPSRERTQRIFIAAVKDGGRWSLTGRGASIDFGDLLGVEAGHFACTLRNDELQAMAQRGVSFPP